MSGWLLIIVGAILAIWGIAKNRAPRQEFKSAEEILDTKDDVW